MVLKLTNATKIYGKKKAIDSISFGINEGEIVGYLGPNGSGKTTTMKAIVNQIELTDGTVEVLGNDSKANYISNYGKIGAVFEKNGLYERLSGKDNVDFYLSACGVSLQSDTYEKLLLRLNLWDSINKPVNTYSKGMKRKLALCRCLLVNPKVLLLDEPFDGIDIESRADIIRLIKDYNKNYSTTIVLTSHVMADIEDLASRIIIIKNGRVLVDESIAEFDTREGKRITDKYLEAIGNEG